MENSEVEYRLNELDKRIEKLELKVEETDKTLHEFDKTQSLIIQKLDALMETVESIKKHQVEELQEAFSNLINVEYFEKLKSSSESVMDFYYELLVI